MRLTFGNKGKSVFKKKKEFLEQTQSTFWYFLLARLLGNELVMMHVKLSQAVTNSIRKKQ